MSDIMRPIPFPELMNWIMTEQRAHGTIFGVYSQYHAAPGKTLSIFGESIETPCGPAAGPHTQLAQNIIAAYVAGGRFFELKTVQQLDGDDLPVSKPCIKAEDEGYNVEWSTELYVPQAYDEYVKAWYALKLISEEYGFGGSNGFVFNMSVGYDLAGIKTPKIDRFIDGIKEARGSDVWRECETWARANKSLFRNVDDAFIDGIDSRVCKSITLSTLHGCPPDEIERIASYLIGVKRLNTYVKCNPTLLGYDYARHTMDEMGYDYLIFDEHHFKDDLQFADAVPMFKRLLALAAENGVEFGVKLTNTFPVATAGALPGDEMYMSGKALYPLSLSVARLLEHAFDGKLRVSYSGGADCFNIDKLFRLGIWPVTMATTLLKPGGYNRLTPIAVKLAGMEYRPFSGVDVVGLDALVEEAKHDPHHVKPVKPEPNRKLPDDVPLIDCFIAPCTRGCPINQDIPTYLKLVGERKYADALNVIIRKNPLPFITGTICSHRCQSKCTRNFYEESVHIRGAKLVAARNGYDEVLAGVAPFGKCVKNIAVIGGGPAGMAAAFFAARAGASVTIFEKRGSLGGIVRHVIPAFRIGDPEIDRDAAFLDKLGVTVKLSTEAPSVNELLAGGFSDVLVATGAWKHGQLALESGSAVNVLDFLESLKRDPGRVSLGKHVIVIGGGNTAMDAARAAMRVTGVEDVSLVYRRTRRQMPADAEELALAIADGVRFMELLAPVGMEGGKLRCEKMKLGAPDASGRRSPIETGEYINLHADTVISAIGERVDADFMRMNNIPLTDKGRVAALKSGENVYVIGDALRGPATVVEAIADAADAVAAIFGLPREVIAPGVAPLSEPEASLNDRRGALCHAVSDERESERCLECEAVCENCVDVCPNRANIAVNVPGMDRPQIVHIDRLCNECGNCAAFCPYVSAPYKDKLTLFSSRDDFNSSANEGFLPLGNGDVRVRLMGEEYECAPCDARIPAPIGKLIRAVIDDYGWCL